MKCRGDASPLPCQEAGALVEASLPHFPRLVKVLYRGLVTADKLAICKACFK